MEENVMRDVMRAEEDEFFSYHMCVLCMMMACVGGIMPVVVS